MNGPEESSALHAVLFVEVDEWVFVLYVDLPLLSTHCICALQEAFKHQDTV